MAGERVFKIKENYITCSSNCAGKTLSKQHMLSSGFYLLIDDRQVNNVPVCMSSNAPKKGLVCLNIKEDYPLRSSVIVVHKRFLKKKEIKIK